MSLLTRNARTDAVRLQVQINRLKGVQRRTPSGGIVILTVPEIVHSVYLTNEYGVVSTAGISVAIDYDNGAAFVATVVPTDRSAETITASGNSYRVSFRPTRIGTCYRTRIIPTVATDIATLAEFQQIAQVVAS